MHIELPQKVHLITIDVGWTRQEKIIPNALSNLKDNGWIISLVKLSYEADPDELDGVKPKPELVGNILRRVESVYAENGLEILNKTRSPIKGRKRGNEEWLYLLTRKRNLM